MLEQSSLAKVLELTGIQRAHSVPYVFSLLFTETRQCEGFPGSSAGKESTCNAGDLGSVPGLRRSPGEGKGYPLQYSSLENSMDCIVHGVVKSPTQLSGFHFHFTLRPQVCN